MTFYIHRLVSFSVILRVLPPAVDGRKYKDPQPDTMWSERENFEQSALSEMSTSNNQSSGNGGRIKKEEREGMEDIKNPRPCKSTCSKLL